jgi:orotate phosphoribosyltransferase
MSVRSKIIPGQRLGLGTYVNTDVDAKQRVITFGTHTWTSGSTTHKFTQGQTRIDTIDCVLHSWSINKALASASVDFKIGTATGGTVKIRLITNTTAANDNAQTLTYHYWIVGTPDPNRLVV